MGRFFQQFITVQNGWFGQVSAALWLAVAVSFSVRADTSVLPVKLDDFGRITIPITLEGKASEQYFLLDTAARRSLLLNQDSEATGVTRYEKGTLRHFSSDGLLRLPAAMIASWKIGGRTVKNSVIGFHVNNASADGLVGNNEFVGRILHWNPAEKQLNIHTNTLPISSAGWHNIGGRPNRHFSMILKTDYRGVELTVLVATGASKTMLDSDTAFKLFSDTKASSDRRRSSTALARGLRFSLKNYRKLVLPDFRIGAWDLGDINVLSGRIDSDEITGSKNAPIMILGADILLKHEVAFDFRDYQLWFKEG